MVKYVGSTMLIIILLLIIARLVTNIVLLFVDHKIMKKRLDFPKY